MDMKHPPLKLGIAVVLLFATVLATCLVWTPLKIRYYVLKLHSDDSKEQVAGVTGLIAMGKRGRDILAKELSGGEAAADFLIEHWTKVNEVIGDKWGPYPLHLAAEKGYPTVAELLIAKCANINALIPMHNTPLFVRRIRGNWKLSNY